MIRAGPTEPAWAERRGRIASSPMPTIALILCSAALQHDPSALSRRALLSGTAAALSSPILPAFAFGETDYSGGSATGKTGLDDYLEELPPKAKQAYLQYLPQLQLDGDYYAFELVPLLAQPGRWDQISELTASTNIGSAQSVSRLDREFVTPMKILSLAFPPDLGGEEMQTALDKFQFSMFTLSKLARKGATTGNVAGPSAKEITDIEQQWDNGRLALNAFFKEVNTATGLKRLAAIPPKNEMKSYPRSETLYTQLLKDAALCRNRGGEQLAGLWGNLMVYGTVPGVNPCGDSAQKYYSQKI